MYRLCRRSPLLSPLSPLLSPLLSPPLSPPRCPARAALPPGPGPLRASAKNAAEPLKKTDTDPSAENKKLNKSQQLKQIFKEYGAVGVSFHVGISLVSLGIFYLAVSSGVDMSAVLLRLGFSEASLQSRMAAGTSTFVLAYAVHKLFAPVRISITVVAVPFLVRYCRKVGFFKPPASSP
ncbi:protein FAM210B, mitochondrial [Acridotheres tristis]